MPVGQSGEDEVDPVECVVELLNLRIRIGAREVRMYRAERLSGLAVAEQLRGRELGMRGNQPQQLAADIARGSKDGRPNHGAASYQRVLHVYASMCIFMHDD